MSKRTFRFEVNLKKPKAPSREPLEESQVSDAAKWQAEIETKIKAMTKAHLRDADWEDPITAQELLAAYNSSLKRGQEVMLGNRVEATIEYSVFIDEWENKHVVTQPLGAKGQRLSELVVSAEGHVLRLSLERLGGPILVLDHYMGIGLTELLNNEEELSRMPGYSLQLTKYHREKDYLVRVDQVRKRFDAATGRIVNEQEFTLG